MYVLHVATVTYATKYRHLINPIFKRDATLKYNLVLLHPYVACV